MCIPPQAVMAIQAVQGVANFFLEEKDAKEQATFASRQAAAVAEGVRENAVQNYNTLARRENQSDLATAREIAAISRAARAAQGQAAAGAASGGVEGGSVESLFQDFERQELARVEIAKENNEARSADIADQREGVAARAERDLFNSRPAPIARPSLFGALLQIGGDMSSTYLNHMYNPGKGQGSSEG